MKITVITGSPHKKGTTNLLAERFIAGAEEAGNEVFRFDAAASDVHPCRACNYCDPSTECIQKDDMEKLRPHLFDTDAVVFVTPVYFMTFSAQIKAVLDRFYAFGTKIAGGNRKAALLAAAASTPEEDLKPLVQNYQTIIGYLGWEDGGTIIVSDAPDRETLEATDWPEKAYALGREF
jgi:multimeric flavodoxin WrbA